MPAKASLKTLTVADSKPAVHVVPIEGWTAEMKPKAIATEPSVQLRFGQLRDKAAPTARLTLKQARELAAHLVATSKALRQNRKRVKSRARRIGLNRQTDPLPGLATATRP